jgi:hypothetical protein
MKMKWDRVISIATLIAACVAIVLALKKPATVVQPQAPSAVAMHPDTSDPKASQSDQQTRQSPPAGSFESSKPGAVQAASQVPSQMSSSVSAQASPQAASQNGGSSSAKPNINSDAISAMLAKTLGAAGAASLTPDSNVGNGEPNIKEQQVTMDGDVVHGRFLTEIAGKDVWVTISGHMGEKDGYATFDPTEFKVGDMEVPVELVNPALQKKLAEERDRLKIPNGSQ